MPRHREVMAATAGMRDNFGAFMLAVAAFALARTADTWRRWWQDPRAIQMREAGLATAALPVLLGLALAQGVLGRAGRDPLTPVHPPRLRAGPPRPRPAAHSRARSGALVSAESR